MWRDSYSVRPKAWGPSYPNAAHIVHKAAYRRFTIAHDSQTQFLPRPKLKLLGLPPTIRQRIFEHVLHHEAVTAIDLNSAVRFPYTAALVNRELYNQYRDLSVHYGSYEVSMSTTQSCSTFSGFESLKRLMRTLHGAYDFTFEELRRVNLVLNFDLDSAIPLEDVCVNVLPLVMETALLSRDRPVAMRRRIWKNGIRTTVAESTVTHQQLRSNVADALERYLLSHGDGYSAGVWANGLGEVTECCLSPHDGLEGVSDLLSDVEHLEGTMIRVTLFGGKDCKYRDYKGFEWHGTGCTYANCSQLFSFPGSIFEKHRFLKWAASSMYEEEVDPDIAIATERRALRMPG